MRSKQTKNYVKCVAYGMQKKRRLTSILLRKMQMLDKKAIENEWNE